MWPTKAFSSQVHFSNHLHSKLKLYNSIIIKKNSILTFLGDPFPKWGLSLAFFFSPSIWYLCTAMAIQPGACTKNAKKGFEVSLSPLLTVTYTPFGCCSIARAYDLGRDNMVMWVRFVQLSHTHCAFLINRNWVFCSVVKSTGSFFLLSFEGKGRGVKGKIYIAQPHQTKSESNASISESIVDIQDLLQ